MEKIKSITEMLYFNSESLEKFNDGFENVRKENDEFAFDPS